ncbi:uncharacterized protein LOC144142669 isoform X2 [Haemaphysalis longicornis]
MAATRCKPPKFNPVGGNFDFFLDRFEACAKANNSTDDQKRADLLCLIPDDVYHKLQRLLFPKTPSVATYEEVSSALKSHYSPKRSAVCERYRFNQRKQEPNETITDFNNALQEMTAHCEFGNFLHSALLDRLIAGLRSEAIRARLLAMPANEASWERAFSIAKEMEDAGHGDAKYVPPQSDLPRPSTSAATSVQTPRPPNPNSARTVPDGSQETTEQRGRQQQRASVPAMHSGRPRPNNASRSLNNGVKLMNYQKGVASAQRKLTYEPKDKGYICQDCGKGCSSEGKLKMHARTHTGSYNGEC